MVDFTKRGVRAYNTARVSNPPVGATAILPGDLVKYSAGKVIPAADNDKQLSLSVALSAADANAAQVPVVPFADCVCDLDYTGGTPVVGASYGISDQRTVDFADTTNYMVTILSVDTDNATCRVKEYQLGA